MTDCSTIGCLPRSPRTFETSVPGVFAVGDVRSRSMKRVASAVGEGSGAIKEIHHYLEITGQVVGAASQPDMIRSSREAAA